MDDLSRTRTEPSRALAETLSATSTYPAPSEPFRVLKGGSRVCTVCAKKFVARRPEAKACSGRCRMHASRARRLGDLVSRIEAAERALADAATALDALKELAAIGASRVMP